MVYFGWPQAHEDAASRAVYASRAILDALGPLNMQIEPQYGVQIQVRIGLHTGLAVVGAMGGGARQEQLAMGDTPNIAARIQGFAAPDTVVLSAATARLVQSAFVLESMGTHSLKGVAEPMAVCRVRGLVATRHDDDEAPATGVPFLVGRDEEIGLLRRRWEQTKEGLGQVVLLSGEAGIGKSALVEALRTHVRAEGLPRLAFRCSPYHQNSALYPIITHIEHLLRWQRDDTPAMRLDKLERGLQGYGLPLEEVVPLLAALLSVPLQGRYTALTLPPQQQKQQTLDALVAWLAAEAERQPVLVAWEDLHWADPTTLEALGLLVDQAPTVPMLHMLTFRPQFSAPWPSRSHMTPITLNRLERPQVEALIARLAHGKTLPADVVAHIVARTDGVPLYVEELTKMLLASELLQEEVDHYTLTGPLTAVAIPATLQDSLMARLDQLHAAKEVAQLGAVLGREFPYDMLQAVSPQDEATLQAGLQQLVEAELLYQRGRPPRARYLFKHALIQDAAYASLLRSTRQQVHQQVARLLEERFPETVATQPELLAHHYTAAGHHESAFTYWRKAGEQAQARSAYAEAIAHLRQGLELLTALPDTPERLQHELDVHMTLALAYHASKGQAAPEVEQTYMRARELCEHLGDDQQLFYVLMGLMRSYGGRRQGQKAWEAMDALCQIAQRTQDPRLLMEAYMAQGIIVFQSGQLAVGRDHLEQAVALYTPDDHPFYVAHASLDPGVTSLSRLSWTLWLLGYPEQALVRSQQTLTLARDLGHVHSLAMVCNFAAILHLLRGEDAMVEEQVEAATALATRHHLHQWLEQAAILQGWYLARHGQGAAGVAQMQQALTTYRKRHAQYQVWFLALLAEAYGQHGENTAGLERLDEALALAAHNVMDSWWEPELHRLKGVLLLTQSPANHAEAETCFLAALDMARLQQAKAWELRAAMSLSRLWQQQGKREEACQLLAPIYGWFTEGFDTADLQEAGGLLARLSS
jgi:predicted ATPase